jgi:dephospho-CoA kinase
MPLFRLACAFLAAWCLSRSALAQKRVVVFVGMPGAGKSTAADLLAKRLGVVRFTSGDVIRQTIAARGLPYTPENDRAVALEFARRPGEIGRRVAANVATQPGAIAVVEGFRAPADVTEMRKTFPHLQVVAVEVGAAMRYARMLARKRPGEDNLAFLRARDRREIATGVRQVMRGAELRIRPRGDDFKGLERSLHRIERVLRH